MISLGVVCWRESDMLWTPFKNEVGDPKSYYYFLLFIIHSRGILGVIISSCKYKNLNNKVHKCQLIVASKYQAQETSNIVREL